MVSALLVTLAALLTAALSTHQWLFLAAAFVIGLSCVAAQVLVPYAAHFTAEAHRGRAVGNVMMGLLLGIMLSRPVASVIAGVWSWHAVYFTSAVALALLIAVLWRNLPQRRPTASMGYLALLGSMGSLVLSAFLLSRTATHGSEFELLLLGTCGILIDLGVAANLVLGQRAIFVLGAESRSRLNGLYMATFFFGGAVGSSVGAWSYFAHGWSVAALLGAAASAVGLACFGTELCRKSAD